MLPYNAISIVPKVSAFLAPDVIDDQELESLEQGGVALNNPSQGRQVQTWKGWIDGQNIKCAPQPANTPITTILTTTGTITSMSLAFDSNMAPTVCYVEDGLMKLYFFNTITALFQTNSYPGVTSGRVSTDDKRRSQEGASDVIFAYTRNKALYWRQQRDRYLVERLVGPSGDQVLDRLGMTAGLRLQFELLDP